MAIEVQQGAPAESSEATQPYSLAQLVGYALGLGTWGFGGPVALVGYMHRDLVERRKWISESDYREGLTLSQIMPGPLAAQLAIYLGYVHYGLTGATLVGLSFVLPSFLMVLALGWAYKEYGGLPWMQAVFYGIGGSVIGIIAISTYRLMSKTLGREWLLWSIFLVSAAVTIAIESEVVLLFLASGFIVWFAKAPPNWLRRSGAAAAVLPLAMLADAPAAENRLW